MPRTTAARPSTAAAERRHVPLADDILNAGHLRTKKANKRKSRHDDDAEADDHYIDAKSSRKILQIGQDLAEEEAAEERAAAAARRPAATNSAFDFESRFGRDLEEGSDEEEFGKFGEEEDQWEDEGEVEEIEVDPNDLEMFHKFVGRDDEDPIFNPRQPGEEEEGEGTNLADLILEKIAAYEAKQSGQPQIIGGGLPEDAVQLPAKAVEVYENDSDFHISKPHIAQHFISVVLLDRVREEIRENKKLHVHIYNALKKALYKPACFFKGFLFPLVAGGTCTLREAHIVSSVIARVSIPVLHSAAALLRLCEISAEQTSTSLTSEGTGATNIFIRVFLQKKYALPYKVIDALVFHFLRFRAVQPQETDGDTDMNDPSAAKAHKLPVLWHQSLLVFAQRYRNDITEDQREALLDLLLVAGHKDIGPEVRRELLAGRGRGVMAPELQQQNNGGDDTMDVTM
ncbi:bystin-family protein [Coccidioides immitis H538.4]|uniref:Bystin-family protein n=1 Tax=Coccidioides immitis H538.4 TaxID=396776 RepID=A0A0J8S015_COCIT|nr:bystin-family protein [Coccidioides immitis H538.4]